MSEAPLHIQILIAARNQTRDRMQQLETRCGTGLADQDYQRTVGRIAECKNTLEMIQELMKGGLDDVEDTDNEGKNGRRTPRSTARSNRRTQ